jgi:hypothetical protein
MESSCPPRRTKIRGHPSNPCHLPLERDKLCACIHNHTLKQAAETGIAIFKITSLGTRMGWI